MAQPLEMKATAPTDRRAFFHRLLWRTAATLFWLWAISRFLPKESLPSWVAAIRPAAMLVGIACTMGLYLATKRDKASGCFGTAAMPFYILAWPFTLSLLGVG